MKIIKKKNDFLSHFKNTKQTLITLLKHRKMGHGKKWRKLSRLTVKDSGGIHDASQKNRERQAGTVVQGQTGQEDTKAEVISTWMTHP